NNDQDAIAKFRAENGLPSEVNVYTVNFGIRSGHFVLPDQKEAKMNLPVMSAWNQNHPSMYASLNPIHTEIPSALVRDRSGANADAQVFLDDVIVGGSLCVGIDCNNSESFGFDTQRLKENNLRIHFDDTSSSASFPGNDWRITVNDSSNGGNNRFSIDDATANTSPLYIEAGAGNNALHIDATGGNIGMGTSTPAVELVITDGDSPTVRLEQNGASGWTPQIWDLAGNETNFFVRDVTNGSKLPFKIKPGAPDNSIFIKADGNIGLGTANPTSKLQVESGDVLVKTGNVTLNSGSMTLDAGDLTVTEGNVTFSEGDVTIPDGQLGIGKDPTSQLDVQGFSQFSGTFQVTGTSTFRGNVTATNSAGTSTVFHVDHTNTRVGIGTNGPNHLLELNADDAVKPNGGSWSGPSDRRLKTNITNFGDGLSELMKFRPVNYNYNGKLGLPTDENFVGLIAQEVQEIAPYMIKDMNPDANEGEEKYLAVNPTALTYILVNAVKEQQTIIDDQKAKIEALEGQLASLDALKAQVAALAEAMNQNQAQEAAVETISEERD
ncbi:MAG: tail fiber domain-containing protein, partial [Bacteroidota bacterium]